MRLCCWFPPSFVSKGGGERSLLPSLQADPLIEQDYPAAAGVFFCDCPSLISVCSFYLWCTLVLFDIGMVFSSLIRRRTPPLFFRLSLRVAVLFGGLV